jgi:hypothetical protein
MYEISRTDECTHSFAKTASEYLCRAGVLRAFGMATRRKYVRQGELRAVEKELALAEASVLRLTGVEPASYAIAPSAKYRFWHGQYSSIGFCNTCMQCTVSKNCTDTCADAERLMSEEDKAARCAALCMLKEGTEPDGWTLIFKRAQLGWARALAGARVKTAEGLLAELHQQKDDLDSARKGASSGGGSSSGGGGSSGSAGSGANWSTHMTRVTDYWSTGNSARRPLRDCIEDITTLEDAKKAAALLITLYERIAREACSTANGPCLFGGAGQEGCCAGPLHQPGGCDAQGKFAFSHNTHVATFSGCAARAAADAIKALEGQSASTPEEVLEPIAKAAVALMVSGECVFLPVRCNPACSTIVARTAHPDPPPQPAGSAAVPATM